jgi:hypothetical protein
VILSVLPAPELGRRVLKYSGRCNLDFKEPGEPLESSRLPNRKTTSHAHAIFRGSGRRSLFEPEIAATALRKLATLKPETVAHSVSNSEPSSCLRRDKRPAGAPL